MTGWKLLKWLPNCHGYPFTGKLRDGTTVRCRVMLGADGLHKVEGAEWADLMGWRE